MKSTLKVWMPVLAAGVLVIAGSASPAVADDGSMNLSLRNQPAEGNAGMAMEGYDLAGPYYLRSADPESAGEIELKLNYSYEHEGDDDDAYYGWRRKDDDESEEHEVELEFEWGVVENWEFILEVPFIVGDGEVEGNGDATIGLHTRLWDEDGWIPAFAVRNMFRVPTGYHGQDFDYTLRGLFTWTLCDSARLHLNPYIATRNDADFYERNFLYGGAIGFDWRLNDDFLMIADYQYRRSEDKGEEAEHRLEFGGEWEFTEDQLLGFGVDFGINDSDAVEDYTISLSYIYEIEAS